MELCDTGWQAGGERIETWLQGAAGKMESQEHFEGSGHEAEGRDLPAGGSAQGGSRGLGK